MNRREFMRGTFGCVLAFAAPRLVKAAPQHDPQEIVWAKITVPRSLVEKMSAGALAGFVHWEMEGMAEDASEVYERVITFEIINEDGQTWRYDQGQDHAYLLLRERLDLHPYWKHHLGEGL